jgi:hypothetical protein
VVSVGDVRLETDKKFSLISIGLKRRAGPFSKFCTSNKTPVCLAAVSSSSVLSMLFSLLWWNFAWDVDPRREKRALDNVHVPGDVLLHGVTDFFRDLILLHNRVNPFLNFPVTKAYTIGLMLLDNNDKTQLAVSTGPGIVIDGLRFFTRYRVFSGSQQTI